MPYFPVLHTTQYSKYRLQESGVTEKLPDMKERERGYLEGTIATAAAMSKLNSTETYGGMETT